MAQPTEDTPGRAVWAACAAQTKETFQAGRGRWVWAVGPSQGFRGARRRSRPAVAGRRPLGGEAQ